jgi:hypothetical protein
MTARRNHLGVIEYILFKVTTLLGRVLFIADCGLRIADFLIPTVLAEAIRPSTPLGTIRNKDSRFGKTTSQSNQTFVRAGNAGLPLAILVLVIAAQAARAEVDVRLAPSPSAAVTAEGFLPAELTVADPNGELPRPASALAIRRAAGGPTMFYETSMAPGATGTFRVMLPMVSVRETYVVSLLAEATPTAPAVLRRDVTAQTDDVAAVEAARDRLIDRPAYDGYIEDLPRWPAWVTRNVVLAAALLLVAMGAALLIRRRTWRLAAGGAAVAVASAGLYISLSQCPPVIERRNGDILAVSCRRTTEWSDAARGIGPVYWRPQQMNQDDMVYQPDATLTLTLHPDEVRLFRCRTVDSAP